jgi:NAD(P)-dependent dehydrogenase (short-subunit alcohol dehydrogenase family)
VKTWLVTGSSRGFGKVWARAALARGDRVAGTARNPADVADLVAEYGEAFLAVPLDVTDRTAVFSAVDRVRDRFGRLDVVVNNAGYGLFGMVEELTEAELRDQMETNLFGATWVTQAVLPVLRERGGGRLLQVSSVGGVVAQAGLGGYHASKWALEGLSQALAEEVRPFGIHVTIVEPVGFATDWRGTSAVRAEALPAYQPLREAMASRPAGAAGLGDPAASGAAMLELADQPDPPLRCFLGAGGLARVRADYEGRLREWEQWNAWSASAHRSPGEPS